MAVRDRANASIPPAGDARPRAGARSAGTARRRKLLDRLGRRIVSLGGLTVIASILGILVFIVVEVAPLLRAAEIRVAGEHRWSFGDEMALVVSEDRGVVAALASDGRLRAFDVAGGMEDRGPSLAASAAAPLAQLTAGPGSYFAGATDDGRVLVAAVTFDTASGDHERRSTPALGQQFWLELDPERRPLVVFSARLSADGGAVAAAQLADGSMVLTRRLVEQNSITGEQTESTDRRPFPGVGVLSALALDENGRSIFGGSSAGDVIYWPVHDGVPGAPVVVHAGAAVTALALLIGDRTLIVGGADGAVGAWLLVRQQDQSWRPVHVRSFGGAAAAVRQIAASPRDKSFLVQYDRGRLALYHSTSERTLWDGSSPALAGRALQFAPKGDGAALGGGGKLARLVIRNPHPEVSWQALFGKVWYEGYSEPRFVWQSSSGTDDFEPKLSLTPLLVGTLKGTFYSLILAIPLGVLGAMYASQFMHYSLKRVVKPAVEIMAALPSVVLGFLAALWLAPLLERFFPALLLMVVALPALSIAAGRAYLRAPARWRARFPAGVEIGLAMAFLALGALGCVALSRPVERLVFGGDFQAFLQAATGLGFDQRNAVVVGLAMGFAVIPIIFSVAEEAFSNVPRGLVAGSLALGASRWQTVTRVVLPSASPGIFSAIMIGFGRAVGETMIVLMATGNTPIMDWSPFNGFRTLSANIAVEIPEAPHGGTLYRTLFLAGLLLFGLTFAVNTVAEVVRQRLRRRYATL